MADLPTNHLTVDQVVDSSSWIADEFDICQNPDGNYVECIKCCIQFDGNTTIEELGKHLDLHKD